MSQVDNAQRRVDRAKTELYQSLRESMRVFYLAGGRIFECSDPMRVAVIDEIEAEMAARPAVEAKS